MKRKYLILGIIFIIIILAIGGLVYYLDKLSENQNLEFSIGECSAGVNPFNSSQMGVQSYGWIDDELVVRVYVSMNCGDEITQGNYNVNENKITLIYKKISCQDIDSCLKCMCAKELTYKIKNLEKKEYEIKLLEDEKMIGGCAGVSLDNVQECCNNWADENSIVRIQCVGEWEIKDNDCSWKCQEF